MQDRLTYANGNTITTEGFRCSVGEPIDIKVTVGEGGEVTLSLAAGKRISNGDYLITLEVNGEKAAYRDLYHLGEDTVTIGNYTFSDDMYLTGVSEGDEVVIRLEPVELSVSDAFRAAVGKVAPSGGGSGGGGVVVVHATDKNNTKRGDIKSPSQTVYLDKTWQEIADATFAVYVEGYETDNEIIYGYYNLEAYGFTDGEYWVSFKNFSSGNIYATSDTKDGVLSFNA